MCPIEKCAFLKTNQIKSIVKRIVSVDMETPASNVSSSSEASVCNKPPRTHANSPKPNLDEDDLTIDGKPFFYTSESIGANVRDFVDQLKNDEHIAIQPLPLRDEDHFRAWALRERARFQGKASDQDDADDKATTDSYMTGIGGTNQKKSRFNPKNVIRHITGYMYGPFTCPPSPDGIMRNENKFGIPTSMTDRAHRFEKNQTIQEAVLRRARLDSLGFKQPPDKEDSSDDNESLMNVKKLALVRTPYFTVPTIRVDQVKRTKRFRNKFLRNDRLKRINLLLRDDKNDSQDKGDSSVMAEQNREATHRRKQSVVAKFMKLMARNKTRPDDRDRDPEKSKYYGLINDKFVESRNKCEPVTVV